MSFNGGKVILGFAVLVAVVLAVGFVWVNFFGLNLAG